MQISRFTASKPSKFAFASDEKSIRQPTTSFARCYLYSYAAGNSEMMKKTVETEARLSEILQKLTNESAQEDSCDAVEQSADDRGEVETPIA